MPDFPVDPCRTAALAYVALGYSPVPLPARKKGPTIRGWQDLRITPETVDRYTWAGVGIILGDPSHGLVDVDLDSPDAVRLADEYLPPTSMVSGHASSPRSHRWYFCPDPRPTRQFRASDGESIVELRSTGGQTVVPPSIHPSGEPYTWDSDADGEPRRIAYADLLAAVERLAVASGWVPPVTVAPTSTIPPAPTSAIPPTQDRREWPAPAERERRARLYARTLDPAVSGQGGHDTAIRQVAKIVRGFGLDPDVAYRVVAEEWNPRCVPPWNETELAHKIGDAADKSDLPIGFLLDRPRDAASQGGATPTPVPGWPDPIPLAADVDPPPFPVAVLPAWVRDYCARLAESSQTPPDLACSLALAVLAGAVAGKFQGEPRPGWFEPTCLYVMISLAPGERKSAVFRDVTRVLREREARIIADAEPAIAAATEAQRTLTARADALRRRAVKGEDVAAEVAEVQEAIRSTPIPPRPRLIAGDATPEALVGLLQAAGGRLIIASAEGGLFDTLAGRYSDGNPCVDAVLQAHCGETIRVDRVGRPSEYVPSATLTLALAVQPDVIHGLAKRPLFRGRGLLARILYSVPRSRVGTRQVDPRGIHPDLVAGWADGVGRLLDLPMPSGGPHPPSLVFSAPARERLTEYMRGLEPRLAPEGDLRPVADWASKLAGAVVRIASIIALADRPGTVPLWVDGDSVDRAIIVGNYFLVHARIAIAAMGADPATEDARAVLGWLGRHGQAEVSRRDAWQALRHRAQDMTTVQATIDVLVAHGYLRPIDAPGRPGPGRPPAQRYAVHPAALTAEVE